jgi:hypothetical protein
MGQENGARTAEKPGQALNIDLCFVLVSHETEVKLPAVSGSSGRLVIEQPKDPTQEKSGLDRRSPKKAGITPRPCWIL